jgi:hypothetical protein
MEVTALAHLQVLLQIFAYQQLTTIRALDRQILRKSSQTYGPRRLRPEVSTVLAVYRQRGSRVILHPYPPIVRSRVVGTGESEEEPFAKRR